VGVAAEVEAVRQEGCSLLKSSKLVSHLKWVCAAGVSSATSSALSDSLLDNSISEASEAVGEEVRTSAGKD